MSQRWDLWAFATQEDGRVFLSPEWFSDIQEEDMSKASFSFSAQERFEGMGSLERGGCIFSRREAESSCFLSLTCSFEVSLPLFCLIVRFVFYSSHVKSLSFGPCPSLRYWKGEERGLDLKDLRAAKVNASGLTKRFNQKSSGFILLSSLGMGSDLFQNSELGLPE